jgi:hypothetical protein
VISISSFGPPARLDPQELGLEGDDLRIAAIIADETERVRSARLKQQLDAMSSIERATVVQGKGGLLGARQLTREEAAREQVHAQPWDAILRDLNADAHSGASERTGLSLSALIEFAIAKCYPSNWEALFWYQHWVTEIGKLQIPWDQARALIADAYARAKQPHLDATRKAGKRSAEVRQHQARTPTAAQLEREALLLMQTGTPAREVNKELAKRHHVARDTIAKARRLGGRT